MKKNYCHITMLVDRSGSMSKIRTDMIGGMVTFIEKQKTGPGDCTLTLIQFDSTNPQEIVIDRMPIGVISASSVRLEPRNRTPLRDALGLAIVETGRWLSMLPEDQRPDKVVFVVVTDGEENASIRYAAHEIRRMIEHQEQVYKWDFIYMGANQDAIKSAAEVGIKQEVAMNFKEEKTAGAWAAAASNVRSYRVSGQKVALNYSEEQIREANS